MATNVHPHTELRASSGDCLVIRAHHLGEADRDAEILECSGKTERRPSA
jgi:hypothetical protein